MPAAALPPIDGIDRLIDAALIRLLLTIAETGGFAAAATLLGISQPAVSQQVKRIEGGVGRTLFRRGRRGVELTPDGEAVVLYGRAMLSLAQDLRRRLAGPDSGTALSVAMSEDFCRTGLYAVLRLFVLDHPHVRLRIVSGTYDTIAAAVEANEVDLAITRRWHRFPAAETLFRDELVWYGGPGLRLPIADPVPLALPLPPNATRSTVLDVLEEAGRAHEIRVESVGFAGLEMAIAADLGVCAGPRGMKVSGVAPLPPGHGLPALPQVEFVLVRADGPLSDIGHAFTRVVATAAASGFRVG